MTHANLEIRLMLEDHDLKIKDIAAFWGVRSDYVSRIMRSELSEKNRERILTAIRQLSGSGEGVSNGEREAREVV